MPCLRVRTRQYSGIPEAGTCYVADGRGHPSPSFRRRMRERRRYRRRKPLRRRWLPENGATLHPLATETATA